MQKFLLLLLLLSITTYANELHVKSLHVKLPQTQPLKHKPLKTTITATLQDGSTKQIDDDITWITTPPRKIVLTSKSIIIPNDDITITLQAKYKNKLSNKLTLHVKWIVDGHTLPPMPDPKINNSTLLGIDSNNNGVRDDVERKIYRTYKRPIERAYMMQDAKWFPKTIINPREAAKSKELGKFHWNLATCRTYLRMEDIWEAGSETVEFMESVYFNTKERIRAYLQYNDEMSGGLYSIPLPRDANKTSCGFDVDKMLELEK